MKQPFFIQTTNGKKSLRWLTLTSGKVPSPKGGASQLKAFKKNIPEQRKGVTMAKDRLFYAWF
jgi:hypothetical protein